MKVIVIFICALVGISHQINIPKVINDFEDTVDHDSQNCYKTFDLNRQKLDGILNQKTLPNNNDNFKCFLNCVLVHLGIADDSAKLVKDVAIKYLETDDATATKVYDACKDSKGPNNCESIFQIISCVHNKIRSPNI
ncbi:hypothetical protein FQA39_LY16580 [Lamprigera yunnana]|nr:hypothetical protein FQA39_LY16580 [Lamprigera yunnana]